MRPATPADFETIYAIYMDETVNPFMHYDPIDKEAFRSVFDGIMARDYVWLFQDDAGRDYGMASAVIEDGRCAHIAEIRTLGIKKDYQGRGLGKEMMGKIIAFLNDAGMERIQLFAESDNERGLKFYKSLGFTEEGRMKNYLKRGPGHYVDEVIFGLTDF